MATGACGDSTATPALAKMPNSASVGRLKAEDMRLELKLGSRLSKAALRRRRTMAGPETAAASSSTSTVPLTAPMVTAGLAPLVAASWPPVGPDVSAPSAVALPAAAPLELLPPTPRRQCCQH